MRTKTLGAIAIATVLLVGSVAALGAAAPADAASDKAKDVRDDRPNDDVGPDERANVSDDRSEEADSVGPSDGLPGAVPEHVRTIHETIESFLGGEIDHLGDALGASTSAGGADDGEANDDVGDGA